MEDDIMSDDNALKYKIDIDINNKNDVHVIEMEYIEEGKTVLDVGCACGDLGVALKAHKKSEVYGLERERTSASIALKTGAYVKVNEIDCDALSSDDFPEYRQKFAYIICGDVLEHLREPMKVLGILKTYLAHGGYIIASIPNISHASIKANLLLNDFTYTPVGLLDETHIRFFTHKSIAEEFSRNGFRICECSFTLQEVNGCQPYDPYPFLSEDIKKFIFEDWHSFVCQYVVKIQPSEDYKHDLIDNNINIININENNAPHYIKSYREYVLSNIGDTCENKIKRISYEYEQNIACCKNKIKRKKKKYKTISIVLFCICIFMISWVMLKVSSRP